MFAHIEDPSSPSLCIVHELQSRDVEDFQEHLRKVRVCWGKVLNMVVAPTSVRILQEDQVAITVPFHRQPMSMVAVVDADNHTGTLWTTFLEFKNKTDNVRGKNNDGNYVSMVPMVSGTVADATAIIRRMYWASFDSMPKDFFSERMAVQFLPGHGFARCQIGMATQGEHKRVFSALCTQMLSQLDIDCVQNDGFVFVRAWVQYFRDKSPAFYDEWTVEETKRKDYLVKRLDLWSLL